LVEQRQPTSAELSASVRIGQWLEKAKYRERDEHEIASIVPPGRLRSKAILQNVALKSRGVNQRVEPFRRTVRKHTDDPTLNVGIMVDISGSMGSAMKPMATTAWVMSSAVNRIQGNCAMVYYGNDVFPTLKIGQKLSEVNVYSASDGTEKFSKAFQALDGALNLLHGNGARLLVVVSDGEYSGDEVPKSKEIVAKCKEAGVAILWLPFDSGRGARDIGGDYAEIVLGINQPEEASEIIPGGRDKDFQIGGIQANIPPNAAQIAAWVSNKRLTTQQAMVLFEKYGFTTWDFITAGWELGKRNFPIRNFPK
jgi:hypothetical protein